jgi:iron complex outermembrane receptor protein
MLNADIGLKGKDDRWEVQLFGKNLTDEFYYGQLYSVSIIARPYGFLPRDFHRYVGLKIVNRF